MRELTFDHITNGNEVYFDCLNAILGNTPRNSMIDLGCNLAPHTSRLGFKERKYIDILPRILDYPEEQQYFEQADILKTPINKYYDVSFALDVPEHLTIDNGLKLYDIMLNISGKVICFTPLNDIFGFDWVTDDPEAHRSLWQPEMLESLMPDTWVYLSFPNFHKIWNGGAFFYWHCKDLDKEFERITNEINKFSWAK